MSSGDKTNGSNKKGKLKLLSQSNRNPPKTPMLKKNIKCEGNPPAPVYAKIIRDFSTRVQISLNNLILNEKLEAQRLFCPQSFRMDN